MEKIVEFFEKVSNFLAPYLDKMNLFFGKGWYIIYAGILLLLVILVLIGLITALIKFPKTFIFLFILIAAFCTVSYFLIYKGSASAVVNCCKILLYK